MKHVQVAEPTSGGTGVADRVQLAREPHTAHRRARTGIPDAMLVVAAGMFLVAWAYVRSREGMSFATPLFWTGHLIMFGYIAYRVLRPATSSRERVVLIILYAGAQSVLRWAYSPYMFTFSDELQHWRALDNVLTTHHLFQPNYSLPVSTGYPGLENVTAELVQVSSLGPFVSGVLIAGAAHILLAGCILALLREVSQSSRIAAVGTVIYLVNPHAAWFDTSFIYQTLALPFLVLAILFAIRFAKYERGRYLSFFGCLSCFAIVAMTHHVTSVAAIVLLAAIALFASLLRDTRNLAWRLALCAVAGAGVYVCWVIPFAPTTFNYLGVQGGNVLRDLANWRQFQLSIPRYPPGTPLIERILGPGSALLTLGLCILSLRLARSRPPLERCFVWLAIGSYVAAIATRIVLKDGPELAGRAFTFTTIFTALAIAALLVRPVSTWPRRLRYLNDLKLDRPQRGLVAATALAVVLFVGSVMIAVPVWWQRLPGPFRIDGNPSGVDAVGTSRAEWAGEYLQPGDRFYSDVMSLILLATVAELDPIRNPLDLYYTDRFTPENAEAIRGQSAIYVDVDKRMSYEAPMTGAYFGEDINFEVGRTPMDVAGLVKFDNQPGISRIYDSGYAHLFDVRGGRGSPYAY